MKLSREDAWKLHREVALKLSSSMPFDLARVSFAVNLKENRQLDTAAKNSKSTARGLMQMLKGTQCEIETKFMRAKCTPDFIYDAKHAIELAQRYLLYQFSRYGGSWRKAVHAYNQGSYNPSRKRAFTDGENYATNVLAFYNAQDYAALDASIGIQSGGASSTRTTTYSGWS